MQVVRMAVQAIIVALLIGKLDAVQSDDPYAGIWSLTYHLTTKPGHETYVISESGQTVTQQTYLTHVYKPAFTVNPDSTFAFTEYETGCNRNEHKNTSPGGAVHSIGKWQVYLKVIDGKVDGEVVRLTLEQAFGRGEITSEFPAFNSHSVHTTLPDRDTVTQVTTTNYGTETRETAKTPGGYTPHSSWGSQKWELKKTSQNGTMTIYSAARDKQLEGGLLVVETVEVQRKTGSDLVTVAGAGNKVPASMSADLEVSINDDPDPGLLGGTCLLTVSVKNLGPDPCPTFELNVSLPQGIVVTLPKDVNTVSGGFTTLQFSQDKLAKDAVATVKIQYTQTSKLPPNQKEICVTAVATVTSFVFDPNPVNNSDIETTKFREKK